MGSSSGGGSLLQSNMTVSLHGVDVLFLPVVNGGMHIWSTCVGCEQEPNDLCTNTHETHASLEVRLMGRGGGLQ
jgi:hypothetical protein